MVLLSLAMRELKQTRTLKFALEAHLGKVVESHFISRWIPMMASDAISFFRIGRDGLTAEMRRSGRAWKKLVAEFGESVHCHPAAARVVTREMQPELHVGRYLGHHARAGSSLIMTTHGVVKAARFRRMIEESRWNVDSWTALRGLAWDVTERGADAAEAIQAPRPKIVHLPLAPRRFHLRKYGVAIGCAACSDIAVHGKTATPHIEECRTRIGEQMEHDPEGHERLQVDKCRQDVQPEVEWDRAPVASPAPLEQQDIEMPLETSGEFASVKRGVDAVADNEERLRANDARNTACKKY